MEIALLWDLLDYAVSSSPTVESGDTAGDVELNVNTQFLSPVNPDVPRPPLAVNQSQNGAQEAFGTSLWNDTEFEFDMTDFANMSDLPNLTLPNNGWMSGHL